MTLRHRWKFHSWSKSLKIIVFICCTFVTKAKTVICCRNHCSSKSCSMRFLIFISDYWIQLSYCNESNYEQVILESIFFIYMNGQIRINCFWYYQIFCGTAKDSISYIPKGWSRWLKEEVRIYIAESWELPI